MTLDDATRARLKALQDDLLEMSPARGAPTRIFERPGLGEIRAWLWARYQGHDEHLAVARAAFDDPEAVDLAQRAGGVLHAHVAGIIAWLEKHGADAPIGETR